MKPMMKPTINVNSLKLLINISNNKPHTIFLRLYLNFGLGIYVYKLNIRKKCWLIGICQYFFKKLFLFIGCFHAS